MVDEGLFLYCLEPEVTRTDSQEVKLHEAWGKQGEMDL